MARDREATCPFCKCFVDWHDGRFLPENRYRCRCGCVVAVDSHDALVHVPGDDPHASLIPE